ncbi:hypothetical protein [Sediminibacillus halophilus]|uniref:Uncharacterized protein n=1 Tax=Sediminibacillus halophilus TaxID=482461 RepID=A0A1G9T9A5_9BACI|nr:hypothetical protein [Sediminibacillus halophilus]SDM44208.1 hypothetical protein SAMN05216244_2490 [Sediminibacillus halophilus]
MLKKKIKAGLISSIFCTLIIATYLELNSFPNETFPFYFWLFFMAMFIFPAILIFGLLISYIWDKISDKYNVNHIISLWFYIFSALMIAAIAGFFIDSELFLVILRPIFFISTILCAVTFWFTLLWLDKKSH